MQHGRATTEIEDPGRRPTDAGLAAVERIADRASLAALVALGDEEGQVVGFQIGGLVKLEPRVDRDGFLVGWALPPDLT